MAALPILTRDERTGAVFVEDRRPDGTLVILACAEGHSAGGVAVPSQPPGTTKIVWPMYRNLAETTDAKVLFGSDFVLTLDTSALPPGRLEFDIGQFVERVEVAVEAGEKVVHLDPDQASQWGLRLSTEIG